MSIRSTGERLVSHPPVAKTLMPARAANINVALQVVPGGYQEKDDKVVDLLTSVHFVDHHRTNVAPRDLNGRRVFLPVC